MARCKKYPFTLDEARAALADWKSALASASAGFSYKIGSRSLTRYNVKEIKEMIEYFGAIVDDLSGECCGVNTIGVLARRNIPTDH